MHVAAASVCASLLLVAHPAAAQDLSRYRGVAFGSSVSSVTAITGMNAGAVKVVHERPSLIQEITWRPQYAVGRPAGGIEAAQDITFRFYDDQLFIVSVVYEARLVEGLTNMDIIDAVSAVYGPAVLTAAAPKGAPLPVTGTIHGSAVLARWQSPEHEFTLIREAYPATFRLVGVSLKLQAAALAAETEAARLDKQEAPQREAERVVAEAERKRTAADKARTTNKTEFRP